MSSDPDYLKPGNFDFCLSHVIEECGEVLAAAGKTQRWGRDSYDPTLKEQYQETNEDWLRRELVDLEQAIVRLHEAMVKKCGAKHEGAVCALEKDHEGAHSGIKPSMGVAWE